MWQAGIAENSSSTSCAASLQDYSNAGHRNMRPTRTTLFVPGNRLDRLPKALKSGADLICIDLEDAVPQTTKDKVRREVLGLDYSSAASAVPRTVRINALRTQAGLRDLLVLATLPHPPAAIMIPKVQHHREIQLAQDVLATAHEEFSLYAMLECPEGIANAARIARCRHVTALYFGSADWAAECGCHMNWDSLLTPRSLLVQAAARAAIRAIDGVWTALDDLDGLEAETRRIAALGFDGRMVIHPEQVAPVHRAFRPSASAVAEAQRIIAASEQQQGGVMAVNGRMVDAPIVAQARTVLMMSQP